MTIPQSVFDWFQKPENYVSSWNPFGKDRKKDQGLEELSGNGERDIKSITVISASKNGTTCVHGIEVLWSDDTKDTIGLDKNDRNAETQVLTAPAGGHFTYVRGKYDAVVDALAFDMEDSSGKIVRGDFIGGTGGRYRHSLECFDVENMSVILDGIKGQLSNGYWAGLTNLTFTYRIVPRKNERESVSKGIRWREDAEYNTPTFHTWEFPVMESPNQTSTIPK